MKRGFEKTCIASQAMIVGGLLTSIFNSIYLDDYFLGIFTFLFIVVGVCLGLGYALALELERRHESAMAAEEKRRRVEEPGRQGPETDRKEWVQRS